MITVTLSPATRWSNMNGPTQTGFGREVVAELGQLRRRQDVRRRRWRASSQRREPRLQVDRRPCTARTRVTLSTAAKSLARVEPGSVMNALDRGDDRLRVERRAVVELDPLPQLDRVAELVLRDRPAARRRAPGTMLRLGVEVVEPLADRPVDLGATVERRPRRIERRRARSRMPTTSVPPYFACARGCAAAGTSTTSTATQRRSAGARAPRCATVPASQRPGTTARR